MIAKLFLGLVGLILAPAVGGLIAGLDRRVTARMQSRFGPPILQPFYDVLKLLGKGANTVNAWLVLCSYLTLMSSALAVFLFFYQADLLLIFFVMTIGAVFQVMGALSVNSPYSQVGAQRELIQMLTYEPLIIIVFIGIAGLSETNRVNQVVCKGFTCYIKNLLVRKLVKHVMSDGMHQMCLAKTDTSVQKKRIVCSAGILGYCQTCGMREFIVLSDYKCIECIFRIEVHRKR